jgi:hypothetical protein
MSAKKGQLERDGERVLELWTEERKKNRGDQRFFGGFAEETSLRGSGGKIPSRIPYL